MTNIKTDIKTKKYKTTHIIPWNNNFVIKIKYILNDLDPWSDSNLILEIYSGSDSNKSIKHIQLEETRGILGIYPVVSKDILIITHTKYIDSTPMVLIDFFKTQGYNVL